MTILVVDDEAEIRQLLRKFLEIEEFYVIEAVNGYDAVEKMTEEVKMVILDICMPQCDGIEACARIREKHMVPIMFLTAYSDEDSKMRCFEQGADDYLVKPFYQKDLILRVKALLRRCYNYNLELKTKSQENNQNKEQEIKIGDLIICCGKKKVFLKEKEISLTFLEYEIMLLLATNRGNIFSIQEIYEQVWKEAYYAESANTVMVHIRNLRKK